MDVLGVAVVFVAAAGGLRAAFFFVDRPTRPRNVTRRARRAELRRRAKLDPITDMVEWKAARRLEEAREWTKQLRALMPAPQDYEGQQMERELFSGDAKRAQKALAPKPKGTITQPVVVQQPAHERYRLLQKHDTVYAILDGSVLWDKTGRPWDGRHHTTCPYECDCPDEVRRPG